MALVRVLTSANTRWLFSRSPKQVHPSEHAANYTEPLVFSEDQCRLPNFCPYRFSKRAVTLPSREHLQLINKLATTNADSAYCRYRSALSCYDSLPLDRGLFGCESMIPPRPPANVASSMGNIHLVEGLSAMFWSVCRY